MSKTGEHGAHEGGNRVHPEIVTELFVDEAGVGNVIAELNDFENGLGDADGRVQAGTSLRASDADHSEKCEGDSEAGKETIVCRAGLTGLHQQVDHNENEGTDKLDLECVSHGNVGLIGKKCEDFVTWDAASSDADDALFVKQ